MKKTTAGLVLTLLLLLFTAVSIRGPQPPSPLPADAPAELFSAARAQRHLEVIAREPHPMGTAEHRRVREYLIGELAALGLEPQTQVETGVRRYRNGAVAFGRVVNVAARLEGRGDGPAVLLMSHYDTVPHSPGAADDSTGVAVMLETARALSREAPLANDVIFLFTDGEEPGLLGAHAFAEHHPWIDDVGVALNFEARGSRGPALMFETSAGNGPLIAALDRAVGDPVASSYSYEIYRRMPNDTDFSVLRREAMPGLNFAFIHGGTAYHTAQDSLDRLDLASVQHMGNTALSLARHLANADLDVPWKTRDAIYFNLPGLFVTYPGVGSPVLAVLLAVIGIVVLVAGFRRKRLTVGGLAGAFAVNLLGAGAVGWGLTFVAGRVMGSYNFVVWDGWASQPVTLLGLGLAAAGLTLAFFRWLHGKIRPANLVAGGLLIWLLLAVALSFVAPGGSYLFAWPLAASLGAAVLAGRRETGDDVGMPLFIAAALAIALTALLWAPTLNVIGVALGPGAAGPTGALIFLLLFGPLAVSNALAAESGRRWVAPVVAVAAGLAIVVAVRATAEFNADNRQPTYLLYSLDASVGEARWHSFDSGVNDWTASYLTTEPQRQDPPSFLIFGGPPTLTHAAPAAPLAGAEVRWVAERESASGRLLDLAITWPYEVHRALVFLSSTAEILSVEHAGRQVSFAENERESPLRFVFFAPSADGVELTVELAGTAPLEVEAIAQRYELPELPGMPIEPRPADLMPTPGWVSDSTFVTSVATWTPGAVSPPEEQEEDLPPADDVPAAAQ